MRLKENANRPAPRENIMNLSDTMAIPDVQGSTDTRPLAIAQVGIEAIRPPDKAIA